MILTLKHLEFDLRDNTDLHQTWTLTGIYYKPGCAVQGKEGFEQEVGLELDLEG